MQSDSFEFDLVVIGAGPGGYVAAIRASQLGLRVAVVEKDKPAGVCGNWGCIPSKALIYQAELFASIHELEAMGLKVDRSGFDYASVQKKSRAAAERSSRGVSGLLRKNKVALIPGTATLVGPQEISVDGSRSIKAKSILVATGSRPRELPGMAFDETRILSSNGILAMDSVPAKLLIVGSGAIGMEFAYIMSSFGAQVTVAEMLPRILPNEDHETAAVVEKAFKNRGLRLLAGTAVQSLDLTGSSIKAELLLADGSRETLEVDKVLVAAGRVPNTAALGLEALGIKLDRGFVEVGDYYQTAVPSVYAIGDIVKSPLLAHVASAEGEIAVEYIAGKPGRHARLDPRSIPGATYCEPQIASFGLSEEQAKKEDLSFRCYSFPYAGNGKAGAIGKSEGLVKIVFDPDTHEILGGHAVGHNATEIIHELLLGRVAEILPEDIADMVHAHPTISESVMEAARGVLGRAIHI